MNDTEHSATPGAAENPSESAAGEFLIGILTRETEFVAGAEGPNQRRFVVPAGAEVAVTVASLLAPASLVTAHRLRADGTPGRANARIPRTRLRVP